MSSSEVQAKERIKAIISETNELAFPHMNPDLLDDFITFLYERVDLRSFAQSTLTVKLRYRKEFLRSLPPEKRQYMLFL